jgi:pimeloyl-ACP methyl ester carboxylesterase
LPFLSAKSGRLYYEIKSGTEPALVFVHGLCGSHQDWKPQIDRLSVDMKVVTLDLPGHGASDASLTDYTMEAYAGSVQDVIRACGVSDVILIGHSMGALIILD